jgi:2-hydroxychromene-2-carboxylate isomerase
MGRELEFFFDVGSPAAYLAWTQLPRLVEQTGAIVAYRPVLLGGVFQATGNRSPMDVPAKARHVQEDLGRHARRYGVPFRMNPHFPINTLMLMRGAIGVQLRRPLRLPAYIDAAFHAIWVEGLQMNDPATFCVALQDAGFDPEEILAYARDPQIKERLKVATHEAVARGVFGAPTFFVGEQMFWGQDRLDFVREALQ